MRAPVVIVCHQVRDECGLMIWLQSPSVSEYTWSVLHAGRSTVECRREPIAKCAGRHLNEVLQPFRYVKHQPVGASQEHRLIPVPIGVVDGVTRRAVVNASFLKAV